MSDTHDKFGVRIYPSVASLGGDKTVKIDRFDGVTAFAILSPHGRKEYAQHWRKSYILQAQELAGRAVLMTVSTEDRAMYIATRMMSKAAYAMRQAQRVDVALQRMTP